MRSTIAASVDDLPDPVGPVTSTMPLRRPTIFARTSGRPRSSNDGIVTGISRITTAYVPRCRKQFTRNRATPGRAHERSADPVSRSCAAATACVPMRSSAICCVCAVVNTSRPRNGKGTSSPLDSTCGGRPGEKIRSLTLSRCWSMAAMSWAVGTLAFSVLILIVGAQVPSASADPNHRRPPRIARGVPLTGSAVGCSFAQENGPEAGFSSVRGAPCKRP